MSSALYRAAWPVLVRMPPEWAHALGMLALRTPLQLGERAPEHPFEWRGLRLRNRVGIASGFDKDATCLRGLARLGAGFVEVGTILARPWGGAPVRPRMKRLLERRGLWNRLGFPSEGLARIERRLRAFGPQERGGMRIACNIGPHPLTVRSASSERELLVGVGSELAELARALGPAADFFVLNLSSPNTPGLRAMLYGPRFASEIVEPLRAVLRERGAGARPLLVKLPPEDAAGAPWTRASLEPLVLPLVERGACDGFVAVNTSSRLARELVPEATADYPGGVSGEPLRAIALATVRLLRELVPAELLLVGVGGVSSAEHAAELVRAGADLVEVYTGLVYRGPDLLAECARALAGRS